MPEPKYNRIVTQGAIVGDRNGMVGPFGPSGAKQRLRFDAIIRNAEHFRPLDSEGNMRYSALYRRVVYRIRTPRRIRPSQGL
jgi:hypothetical protein